MQHVSLPRFTQKERHNYRCFEDFKKYIQTYINNPEEKRYLEYRFEAELVQNENPELIHKRKDIHISQVVTPNEVLQQLRTAAANTILPNGLTIQDIEEKVKAVTSTFTEEEQTKIYSMIVLGNPDIALQSLIENDVEHLKTKARETLPFIKLVSK